MTSPRWSRGPNPWVQGCSASGACKRRVGGVFGDHVMTGLKGVAGKAEVVFLWFIDSLDVQ